MQPVFFPHVLSCEWLTSERETQSHDYLVLERILDVRTVDDYYMKSSAVRWKPYGHEDHTGMTCEDPVASALASGWGQLPGKAGLAQRLEERLHSLPATRTGTTESSTILIVDEIDRLLPAPKRTFPSSGQDTHG